MVEQDFLELFLRWLRRVLWNFLEGTVSWSKDGKVRSSAIEELNDILVLVNQSCKLGCVFASRDQLIDLIESFESAQFQSGIKSLRSGCYRSTPLPHSKYLTA